MAPADLCRKRGPGTRVEEAADVAAVVAPYVQGEVPRPRPQPAPFDRRGAWFAWIRAVRLPQVATSRARVGGSWGGYRKRRRRPGRPAGKHSASRSPGCNRPPARRPPGCLSWKSINQAWGCRANSAVGALEMNSLSHRLRRLEDRFERPPGETEYDRWLRQRLEPANRRIAEARQRGELPPPIERPLTEFEQRRLEILRGAALNAKLRADRRSGR
jgi:hypothetical protein